jgi:hypothetical protein
MNEVISASGEAPPTLEFSNSVADPLVLGLERKLDVLRAQLAASRNGEDPGEAGITTWSRLEHQAQQITALNAQIEALQTAATAMAVDLSAAQASPSETDTHRLHDEKRQLQRENLRQEIDIGRLRDEVSRNRQTIVALNQSLLSTALPTDTVVPIMPPRAVVVVQDRFDPNLQAREALLGAILASTSWRITRPMRRFGKFLKGKHDPVR